MLPCGGLGPPPALSEKVPAGMPMRPTPPDYPHPPLISLCSSYSVYALTSAFPFLHFLLRQDCLQAGGSFPATSSSGIAEPKGSMHLRLFSGLLPPSYLLQGREEKNRQITFACHTSQLILKRKRHGHAHFLGRALPLRLSLSFSSHCCLYIVVYPSLLKNIHACFPVSWMEHCHVIHLSNQWRKEAGSN